MEKIDIFKTYKTRDSFFFKAGIMLLFASAFCWIFNLKESYSSYGLGLLMIYLIQYAIETYFKPKIQ